VRVFKCLAQAHSTYDNIGRCRVRPFGPEPSLLTIALRHRNRVAYMFASVKAITVKFLVRENTTRKELQPLELTSKITTEFAYNGTSGDCIKNVIAELTFQAN